MKNTGKILMILVGFSGLLFLFWAGSDLVIERRRGGDIYFSENPAAFILWFIGPGLASLGVIVLGLWGLLNNNKVSAHAKHINDIEKKIRNEIALSNQALEAMGEELLKASPPSKSSSPREVSTTTKSPRPSNGQSGAFAGFWSEREDSNPFLAYPITPLFPAKPLKLGIPSALMPQYSSIRRIDFDTISTFLLKYCINIQIIIITGLISISAQICKYSEHI